MTSISASCTRETAHCHGRAQYGDHTKRFQQYIRKRSAGSDLLVYGRDCGVPLRDHLEANGMDKASRGDRPSPPVSATPAVPRV